MGGFESLNSLACSVMIFLTLNLFSLLLGEGCLGLFSLHSKSFYSYSGNSSKLLW